jgi:hypothetical protein
MVFLVKNELKIVLEVKNQQLFFLATTVAEI